MKKTLIITIAALIALSACSNDAPAATTTAATTAATTTAEETTTTTTTTTETAKEATPEETETEARETEETEPEKDEADSDMIEVTIGEIDLTFDPETWETVEECAERLEQEGDPFTEDEIEFFFDPETPIYLLRGTDAYIWMLAAPLKDFEGFGTKEYYEGIFDKVNNAVTDDDCTLIDAEIEERNDLLFINSFIDNNNGTFSRYITMSKDKFLYTIGLCYYTDESQEDYLYDLIDSISFDEQTPET